MVFFLIVSEKMQFITVFGNIYENRLFTFYHLLTVSSFDNAWLRLMKSLPWPYKKVSSDTWQLKHCFWLSC